MGDKDIFHDDPLYLKEFQVSLLVDLQFEGGKN